MSADDAHPLARAIIATTDRKRIPFVYRPASALTPLQQWEQKVAEVYRLALTLERARTPAKGAGAGVLEK